MSAGRCGYCGVLMTKFRPARGQHQPPTMVTKDHMHPRSRGGKSGNLWNDTNNLMRCCRQCNEDKQHLTLAEWRIILSYRYRTLCIFWYERQALKAWLNVWALKISPMLGWL